MECYAGRHHPGDAVGINQGHEQQLQHSHDYGNGQYDVRASMADNEVVVELLDRDWMSL